MRSKLFLFVSLFFLFLANFVKAQPSAISDLICSSEVPTAGAIELTWTVPSGAVAYEVKYQQGNSINYPTATIYSQSWSAGTAGQKKSEILLGLNPGTEFTFALKSKDSLGNWSAPSNPATCQATALTLFDNQAPFSKILEPKEGENIFAGKDYLIKGESSDLGISSVQKVEISLDGGKNWFLTKPKEILGSGFTFEYLWQKPVEGDYLIKSRATDWWGNEEIPGEGIKVKVIAKMEKEIPEIKAKTKAEELKEKIIEIQKKIIQLLNQLIQLLQEEIKKFQK